MELKKRKSLILHFDSLDIIDELNKEQIADLFIAIRDYNLWKDIQLEWLMKAVFIPLKNQFDRDIEKYVKKCEVNAINWSKWGRPKETQENPVALVGKNNNPNKAYNKNDNNSNSNNNNNKESNIVVSSEITVPKVTTLESHIKNWFTNEFMTEVYSKYDLKKEEFQEECNTFLEYRKEKSINWKKERWEKEKTFDPKLRFRNWMRNNKKFSNRVIVNSEDEERAIKLAEIERKKKLLFNKL